jgi:serine/threonine protein kinase
LIYCINCSYSNKEDDKNCTKCSASLQNCPRDKLTRVIILNERYKLIAPLKAGGMAGIYVAKDMRLNSLCAVKELFLHFFGDDQKKYSLERFKTEAEILAKLRHPNLPCVTDYFFESKKYYLVMDYIAGDDLYTILKKEGSPGLPEEMIVSLAITICKVLEYLHRHQPPIIYRDLKPSNIMIRARDKHIMLVDFGVAKMLEDDDTQTGVGTQGYSPREQYRGKTETRSDIYSLGATLHHLVTGVTPVPFKFKPVRDINPRISEKLEAVLMRALQDRPEDRYFTATEMKHALKLIDREEPESLIDRIKKQLDDSTDNLTQKSVTVIKVFIVEDDVKLRLAFGKMIEHSHDMELIGTAASGHEAVEKFKHMEIKPDIILMDISMPGMDGIEATSEIKKVSSSVKVIILTALSPDRQLVLSAFKAGATGYLIKGMKLADIVDGIRKAYGGGAPIEPAIATFLLDQFVSKPQTLQKQDEIDEKIKFNLEEIDFTKLLIDLCSKKVKGRIEIRSPEGQGEIYLEDGRIIHSSCGDIKGEEAFNHAFHWPRGKAVFSPDILPDTKTISSDTEKLLADFIIRKNQVEKIREVVSSYENTFKLYLPENAAIIQLQPDQLYILAYLDGKSNINDIVKQTGKNHFEISKAIYELSCSGLVKKVKK